MRHILFNTCGIISFTAHPALLLIYLRFALFISSIRRTKPRRSSTRKSARPAETATNGSTVPMSVQSSGTEDLRPFALKNKTRYSYALRLTLSISNSIFLYGWYGWMIRKVLLLKFCWDVVEWLNCWQIRVPEDHFANNFNRNARSWCICCCMPAQVMWA